MELSNIWAHVWLEQKFWKLLFSQRPYCLPISAFVQAFSVLEESYGTTVCFCSFSLPPSHLVGNGRGIPSLHTVLLWKGHLCPAYQRMPCLEVGINSASVVNLKNVGENIHLQEGGWNWTWGFTCSGFLPSYLGKNWVVLKSLTFSGGASLPGIPCHSRFPRQEKSDLFFCKSFQAMGPADWKQMTVQIVLNKRQLQ